MASTPQSQAIQNINSLVSAANQLMSLYLLMQQIDAQWTDDGMAAIISSMGTVALNADGSLGAADGAPNVAHPLNVASYSSLTKAVSSNQIGQIKTILDGVVTYMNGSAVSAQSGARAIINAAIGG
jgi:hypothetical protein